MSRLGSRALTLTASGGGGGSGGWAPGDWTALTNVVDGINVKFDTVAFADFNGRAGSPGTAMTTNGSAGSDRIWRGAVGQTTGSGITLDNIANGDDGAVAIRAMFVWGDYDLSTIPSNTRISLEFVDSQTADGNHYGGGMYSSGDSVTTVAMYASTGASITAGGFTGTIRDYAFPKGQWVDLYIARVGNVVAVWFGQNGAWRQIIEHAGVSTGDGSFILRFDQDNVGTTFTVDIHAFAPDGTIPAALTPPVLALDP